MYIVACKHQYQWCDRVDRYIGLCMCGGVSFEWFVMYSMFGWYI